jgi:isopentenyl diphosphate isomerase/L-lactate dehydrogenase-like FMN-dependent dehydrogenase
MRGLRAQWDGPFLLKGVYRPDEARRAVDAGVSAVSVSNHGGNNLDSTPAALRALPAVARAVGQQVEVAYDGGIRRGSDVAKALALGARAVLVGRPWVFALAASGELGVSDILQVLRNGLDRVVAGLGHSSVHDLSPQDLVIPADFVLERPTRLPWAGRP